MFSKIPGSNINIISLSSSIHKDLTKNLTYELYCVSFMQAYKLDSVIISIVVVRKVRFSEVHGLAKFMTDQCRRPSSLCLQSIFVKSLLQVLCNWGEGGGTLYGSLSRF